MINMRANVQMMYTIHHNTFICQHKKPIAESINNHDETYCTQCIQLALHVG